MYSGSIVKTSNLIIWLASWPYQLLGGAGNASGICGTVLWHFSTLSEVMMHGLLQILQDQLFLELSRDQIAQHHLMTAN